MKTKLNHSLLPTGRILSKAGIALACLLALFPAHVTFAQAVSSAKMHGTVTDNTGAVVSGASVVATQIASGATATAITTDTGSYVLSDLPVGAYRV